jgi:hypothetical protein
MAIKSLVKNMEVFALVAVVMVVVASKLGDMMNSSK